MDGRSIALIAGAVLLLVWWFFFRGGPGRSDSSRIRLLVHDGHSSVLYNATRDAAGNLVANGTTYPAGVAVRCTDEAALSDPLYLLAVEPLALAHHRTLEVARRHIVMGNIFKSGGDLMETLRLVAMSLVAAAALYALMQINTLSGSLSRFDAQLMQVNEKLSKPLVAVPAAPEGQ